MPPLLISPNQDRVGFLNFLRATFPNLQEQTEKDSSLRVTNKAKLIEDYAEIGAFLSNSAQVQDALSKLNARLRERIGAANNQALAGNISDFRGTGFNQLKTTNRRGESIIFKTHKLLSSVLEARENLAGFNNVARGGWDHDAIDNKPDRLHSRAQVGTGALVADGTGRFPLTAVDAKNPPQRPVGVPTLTAVVGGMDFQRILLRHGYHWKDPGAGGVTHGEYTHRLQWYAILEKTPPLQLTNKAIEIFKSMGSLWSRSNFPASPQSSGHTYLWEVLFDCFPEDTEQPDYRPRSGTYNFPDNLTGFLTNNGAAAGPPNSDPLFELKVLMTVRRYKRAKLDQWEPATRFAARGKQATTVLQQSAQSGNDADRIGAFLVWYNS